VLQIGKGRRIRQGEDVAILSLGAHLGECLIAADTLEAEGIGVSVADARFAKPLDLELLLDLAENHRALITVEQGARGGFGAMVLHELAAHGVFDTGLAVRTLTLPDRFIAQASPAEMYADAGLTAADIANAVRGAVRPRGHVVTLKTVS
jgi:1-deoxy-D-xylulose-5-phosphate synthase